MYTPYIQFDQPCPTLLTSCIRITYDNYNTTRINETLIINFLCNYFTITILDHCTTKYYIIIIIIIG